MHHLVGHICLIVPKAQPFHSIAYQGRGIAFLLKRNLKNRWGLIVISTLLTSREWLGWMLNTGSASRKRIRGKYRRMEIEAWLPTFIHEFDFGVAHYFPKTLYFTSSRPTNDDSQTGLQEPTNGDNQTRATLLGCDCSCWLCSFVAKHFGKRTEATIDRSP